MDFTSITVIRSAFCRQSADNPAHFIIVRIDPAIGDFLQSVEKFQDIVKLPRLQLFQVVQIVLETVCDDGDGGETK